MYSVSLFTGTYREEGKTLTTVRDIPLGCEAHELTLLGSLQNSFVAKWSFTSKIMT